jgi:hypothetical protein
MSLTSLTTGLTSRRISASASSHGSSTAPGGAEGSLSAAGSVQNGRMRLDSAGEAADGGMPPRRRRVEARARAAAKAMAAEPETSDKEQGFLVVTRTNGPGLFA